MADPKNKADQVDEQEIPGIDNVGVVEFIPSEEQILAELKRQEKRKQYMNTPQALEARKKYMKKRYEATKATRNAMAALKASNPAEYARLMGLAKASVNS